MLTANKMDSHSQGTAPWAPVWENWSQIVTLGTHFFHYSNLILHFPLMKCLGGKQWRCRIKCLLSLCKQGLTRNLKGANSRRRHPHSVPYTLHIGNNKEKTKHVRKVLLGKEFISQPIPKCWILHTFSYDTASKYTIYLSILRKSAVSLQDQAEDYRQKWYTSWS